MAQFAGLSRRFRAKVAAQTHYYHHHNSRNIESNTNKNSKQAEANTDISDFLMPGLPAQRMAGKQNSAWKGKKKSLTLCLPAPLSAFARRISDIEATTTTRNTGIPCLIYSNGRDSASTIMRAVTSIG